MEIKNNGYFTDIGTIWYSRCYDNSIRIFYMEAKPIHSKNSNARIRPRLQEVGRYSYQTDRPTEIDADGGAKNERNI